MGDSATKWRGNRAARMATTQCMIQALLAHFQNSAPSSSQSLPLLWTDHSWDSASRPTLKNSLQCSNVKFLVCAGGERSGWIQPSTPSRSIPALYRDVQSVWKVYYHSFPFNCAPCMEIAEIPFITSTKIRYKTKITPLTNFNDRSLVLVH